MMRRSVGWWIVIPVALMLFGFIFAAGAGSVVAQGSPAPFGSGGGPQGSQSVTTPAAGAAAGAAGASAPAGNPFVVSLPTQARATGPGGIVYGQYQPRRLRDG